MSLGMTYSEWAPSKAMSIPSAPARTFAASATCPTEAAVLTVLIPSITAPAEPALMPTIEPAAMATVETFPIILVHFETLF